MAGFTIDGDGTVIENRFLEIIRDMAQATVVSGRQVAIIFTRRHNAIVAGIAITVDIGVIKGAVGFQFNKTGGVMAVITGFSGFDMVV